MKPTFILNQSSVNPSFWNSLTTYLHYRKVYQTMIMDDYGNLVPVNFAALAASVAN